MGEIRMYEKTILIVDDEPRTRQGLKKTLDTWSEGKYQVLTAENAEQAKTIVQEQKIHILITDIRMPEITGLQLLEALKKQNTFPVVIVISAYSEFEYAQEALRLGVINYLLKPISKKKLIEAVEEALVVLEKQERAGIIEKVVDEKLLNVSEKSEHTREPIRVAMHYIDQNLHKEITQKEVADHVHLNPSYFSVLFKEQAKLTFSEYLTRRRIQLAKELLISTPYTISEIAERSGYKTAKYFVKMFKDIEGITPGNYRKNHNERAF